MTKAIINTIKTTAILSAILIMSSCSKPKDLKYGAITDVAIKNLSLSGVDVEATIPVENPNGYEIKVEDAALDLSMDDKVIAHVLQSYPVTIAGKTKGDYKVGASIRLANAGAIMSLMSLVNGGGNKNLSLDGTLKAKSFVVTKTVQVHQTNIQNYLRPVIDKLKLF
jgi:LEA14-like dessication related protein